MSFVANWKTHQFDSSLLVHTLYTPRYCSRWLFLNLSFSTLHHFQLETRLSTTRRALSLWVQLGRLDDKFSWQTFHRQLAIIQPFFERTFHRESADNLMDFSAFLSSSRRCYDCLLFHNFPELKMCFSLHRIPWKWKENILIDFPSPVEREEFIFVNKKKSEKRKSSWQQRKIERNDGHDDGHLTADRMGHSFFIALENIFIIANFSKFSHSHC